MKKLLLSLALGALAVACKSTADVTDTSAQPCGDGSCCTEGSEECGMDGNCAEKAAKTCPMTGKEIQ
ncbi:MAG: hypothetical protein AB1726_13915 [Planctomycetota bacterium]